MPGHSHVADFGYSNVVAGSYQATWNDLDIGLTIDGFTLSQSNSGIDITSDITGETVIDTIYSGTVLSITMTLQNWNAQAVEPMIWWMGNGAPTQYEWGLTNGVGLSQWDAAKPLLLNACNTVSFNNPPPESVNADVDDQSSAFTPSSQASVRNPYIDPLDIVFPKTILRKDSNIDILFSFRPRFLTLTLDVYPVSNDTTSQDDWVYTTPDVVKRVSGCTNIRYFAATRGLGPQAP